MYSALQLFGKQPKQSVGTASDCFSSKSRLVVVDKVSKQKFLIDTGSDLCCFPRRLLHERRPAVNYDLSAANGSKIKTYGFLTLNLNLGLRRNFIWRFIVADVDVAIIGSDFLSHYHLLPDCRTKSIFDGITGLRASGLPQISPQTSVKTVNNFSPFSNLVSEFPEITRPSGLPQKINHKTVHHIHTTPGQPVTSKFRRLNPEKYKVARKEFDDMLQAGTARPSKSSWSSPLHLAPKGESNWRPCGDYRALNARTIPDCYPVRHIHDVTYFIDGCTEFSKIDLVKAYQQIPVADEDICKTAIITPFGLFEFPFMTFGLRNAGQTFQRFMDEVLQGLDFCFVYMDDILVFSHSKEEHERHLRIIFDRLSTYGLVINVQKCVFGVPEITFLGYNISAEGIRAPVERVKAIQDLPLPKTAQELRRFLGMLNFYRRFIPHASEFEAPLHDAISNPILKKMQPISWTPELEEAFKTCKNSISSATLLVHPHANAPLALFTDASNHSVGACLQQLVDNIWQPLAFFSKKMSQKESSWPAYYRELLAIYTAIQHFRHFLEGHSFTIYTDHKPLIYAFKQNREKLPPIQLNQLSFIAEFSTNIQHVKGSDNVVADTLSRIEAISTPLNYEKLVKSQENDDELKNIIQDNSSSLKIERVSIPGISLAVYCDVSTGKPRPFITYQYRRAVFESLHNLSHPGANASLKLISDRFVWPSIKKDCRNWARACNDCQRSKISRHTHAPLGSFETPTQRFSHIHIDLIGPLPPAHSFRYCLTVIDRFTRWSEVYPLQSITAESVIHGLLACWISRFGVPKTITSDRGAQFTSHLFKSFTKNFGIKHNFTTSWHPASNGMVERLHRQLKAAIMAHSETDWFYALPLVLLGIRSAFKEDIKATTAELVYGETLRLPGELFASDLSNQNLEDSNSFLSRLRDFMVSLRPSPASRHCQTAVFIFKELAKCSHAFLREGPILKALQPPYTGPHEVLNRDHKTITLKIRNEPNEVSIDRVKPAFVIQEISTPVPASLPVPVSSYIPTSQTTSSSTLPPVQRQRTTRSGRRVRFRGVLNL